MIHFEFEVRVSAVLELWSEIVRDFSLLAIERRLGGSDGELDINDHRPQSMLRVMDHHQQDVGIGG